MFVSSSSVSKNDNYTTRIRIQISIPREHYQEPVLSRLTADYGLLVNITNAKLGADTGWLGWFDLELQGSSEQIEQGLAYIESLCLKVVNHPTFNGDSWEY